MHSGAYPKGQVGTRLKKWEKKVAIKKNIFIFAENYKTSKS